MTNIEMLEHAISFIEKKYPDGGTHAGVVFLRDFSMDARCGFDPSTIIAIAEARGFSAVCNDGEFFIHDARPVRFTCVTEGPYGIKCVLNRNHPDNHFNGIFQWTPEANGEAD